MRYIGILLTIAAIVTAQTQIDLSGQQSYVFGPAAASAEELPGIRHGHNYATAGDGTLLSPWTFPAGNPWTDAIADGGQTIVLVPGYYSIDSCPAIVPDSVTIWGTNRNQVHLRSNCTAYEAIKVDDNAKHVHLRGFSLSPQSGKVAVLILATGSESVFEEIVLYGHQGVFDRTAVLPTSNGSGSITFDAANNPNDTIELDMTGGASRAEGSYDVLTLPTVLQADAIASTLESHLNTLPEFNQDYYAAADGPTLHLMERRFLGAPGTFAVTTNVPNTLMPWAATGRGGNTGLLLTNAFSSKFSHILCGPVYAQFHCITLAGLNNQLSFRDIRHTGGNLAGWGLRTAPGTVIQTVNVDTMTVEAAYGAMDFANLTSSSITGLYMEAAQEYGVRIQDWSTSTGFSFNHANTIRTSRLFGKAGLVMGKGRDITVENSIIEGTCTIEEDCENCTIRSSFAPECTVLSNSGYLQNHSPEGSPVRPVDRYGCIVGTDSAAFLCRPLTNYVIESEDFTQYEAGFAQQVTADDPFGETGQVSRASIANPVQGGIYSLGAWLQWQPLLQPDTTYLKSVWLRVLTTGAQCQVSGLQANRPLVIDDTDGWVRVAAPVRTNETGLVSTNVGCKLLTAGLPSFEFDGWGNMISDLQTDGALPPYIPTSGEAVTVPAGLYLYDGTLTSSSALYVFSGSKP